MEQTGLRACRACLATACELYKLSENGLLEKYQQVTSLRRCAFDGKPKYICSFCRARLLKSYRFRKDCLETDKMISQNAGYLLGISYVKKASRHELSLTEMLALTVGGENEFAKNIDEMDSHYTVVLKHDIALKEDPSEVDMLQNVDSNFVDEPVSNENHMSSTSSHAHLDVLALHTDIKDELLESSPRSELADSFIESKEPLEATTVAIKTEYNVEDNILEILPKNELNVNVIESSDSHVGFNEETIHNTENEHLEKVADDINAINVKMTIEGEGKVNIFKQNESSMRRLKSTDTTAATNESDLPKRNYYEKAPAHIAQQHKELRPYSCELCGRAYKRRSHLNEHHHRSHMEGSPVACNLCGHMFDSKCYLKLHFACNECVMIFESMECLKSHQNEHMDGRFEHRPIVCDICGKIFTSKADVKCHKVEHSEEQSYSCKQCNKTFKTSYAVQLHIKAVHAEERSYPCKHCDKMYKSNSALHHHIRGVHSEPRYSCKQCGVTFTRMWSLKSHQIRRHMVVDSNDQSYTCEQCGKIFITKIKLMDHKRVHKEGQSCSCEICGKIFKTQRNLKCHERLHTSKYFFTCDICSKTFRARSAIQKHIKTVHSEVRPYPCNQCGVAFKQFVSLKRHQQVCHKAEDINKQSHSCEHCGKIFRNKLKLLDHRRMHKEGRSYSCDICGNMFRTKSAVQCHIKTCHINEPWPKLILNRIEEI